jgi:hypothetical protein
VDAADIAAIPASIGVRFERRSELPPARTVPAGRVIGPGAAPIARELTFAGAQTIVREAPASEPAPWPIDVLHAPDARAAIDAAIAAVQQQRVWAPAPGRRVRLAIGAGAAAGADAAALSVPWMADAAARVARDGELHAATSRVSNGFADARLAADPWQTLAFAADGRPVVAVAAGAAEAGAGATPPAGRSILLVVSAADPADIATPLLLRAIANAIAPVADLQQAEVMPIADAQWQQWSRPAAPAAVLTADALRRQDADDDRRWLWLVVLGLIGIETWMRRAGNTARDEDRGRAQEPARVA